MRLRYLRYLNNAAHIRQSEKLTVVGPGGAVNAVLPPLHLLHLLSSLAAQQTVAVLTDCYICFLPIGHSYLQHFIGEPDHFLFDILRFGYPYEYLLTPN